MYESRLRNKWYIIIIIITDDKAKDATDKAKDAADKAKDDADKAKDDAEKVTTETKDKLKDGKSKDDADDDDDEAQAEAKEKLKKAQHAAAGKYLRKYGNNIYRVLVDYTLWNRLVTDCVTDNAQPNPISRDLCLKMHMLIC